MMQTVETQHVLYFKNGWKRFAKASGEKSTIIGKSRKRSFHIMNVMGIIIGTTAYIRLPSRGVRNGSTARRSARLAPAKKNEKIAARKKQILHNSIYEEEEGYLYGLGIAD